MKFRILKTKYNRYRVQGKILGFIWVTMAKYNGKYCFDILADPIYEFDTIWEAKNAIEIYKHNKEFENKKFAKVIQEIED